MIRLAALDVEELPDHPSFESNASGSTSASRPDLLSFALTLLDQGRDLLLPTQFNLQFKHHSQKSSPPSNNEVEVLSSSVPASEIASLPWGTDDVPRRKPSKLSDEFWYARRSYHHNLSVRRNSPGTASWDEFVYGLRDNHSKHEFDFTPTIYDAHHVINWNEELNSLLSTPASTLENAPSYTSATMSIYEMCHKMPATTSPRCFPVLVVTASVSASEFLAVTLPVDISIFSGAFYSNKRNKKEGTDSQAKKSVQLANYVAVERVHKYPKQTTHTGHTHDEQKDVKHVHESEEEIEWVMATASDAGGAIPMVAQRMGVPGAIVKDVGLFLKWIHNVPEGEVRRQGVETKGAGNGAI